MRAKEFVELCESSACIPYLDHNGSLLFFIHDRINQRQAADNHAYLSGVLNDKLKRNVILYLKRNGNPDGLPDHLHLRSDAAQI